MLRLRLIRPLTALALLLLPCAAWAECQVRPAAAVPLRIIGGIPLVTVEVNDQPAVFILDTGAQRTIVSPEATNRLGIARDAWIGTTIQGIGGIERRPNADPHSMSLGGLRLTRRTLMRDVSLPVAELPRVELGGQVIDGHLGNDLLSGFDLDLDMQAATLSLYRVEGCAGRFLPWTRAYAALPTSVLVSGSVLVSVTLDDVPLRALLDSGTTQTLLAAAGMYHVDLRADMLDADPGALVPGFGPQVPTLRRHRFRLLQVGPGRFARPTILAGSVRLNPTADMILGADYLATRRVWISFATRQVFVAE